MSATSILVIGATGRTGVQVIRTAWEYGLTVHAFVRTPSKLSASDTIKCNTIQQGDACNAHDVTQALHETKATVAVLCIGEGNSTSPSKIRENSAKALAQVIGKGTEFEHVKVVIVSSLGAGGTKIDIGMGVGSVVTFVLRHVLKDHDRQEEILVKMDRGRVVICRPTGLSDGEGGKGVKEFVGKPGSTKVDRVDVARWIVERIKSGCMAGEVNITGA